VLAQRVTGVTGRWVPSGAVRGLRGGAVVCSNGATWRVQSNDGGGDSFRAPAAVTPSEWRQRLASGGSGWQAAVGGQWAGAMWSVSMKCGRSRVRVG
jgi:hypothetical protein